MATTGTELHNSIHRHPRHRSCRHGSRPYWLHQSQMAEKWQEGRLTIRSLSARYTRTCAVSPPPHTFECPARASPHADDTRFFASFFICQIVDTALKATGVEVTYIYYVLYIFQFLFWRVADIVIAFTIYRTMREYLCVQHSNQYPNGPSPARTTISGLDKPFRIISIAILALLTILTVTSYGLELAGYIMVMTGADDLDYGSYEKTLYEPSLRITFVYYLIYIFWTVFLFVFVGLKLKGKSRSIVCPLIPASPCVGSPPLCPELTRRPSRSPTSSWA